jgi:hypothetical protein
MSKTELERIPAGYDTDFYEWCLETAALLRDRRFDEVDLEHVAEEIEDMGKRDRREVESRLAVLIMHLLKWQAQPGRRAKPSRVATISEQRHRLMRVVGDSPSLVRVLQGNLASVYPDAVRKAVAETHLDRAIFPRECPFTAEQILRDDFFPE